MKKSIILVLFQYLMFMDVSAQLWKCPDKYLRYSKDHSLCKLPNAFCDIRDSSMSQEDIKLILHVHNTYRSKIAMGQEGNLPTASNMMKMEYDEELAQVAAAYAKQCIFDHDCNDCRRVPNFKVGQNLGYQYFSSISEKHPPDWSAVIKRWYDEVKDFQSNMIKSFYKPGPETVIGHFTQLVWARTWRVGCGRVSYLDSSNYKTLYVCNYGPAGNMLGQSMYEEGTPCSMCPMNTGCDGSNYPGLCSVISDRGPIFKEEREKDDNSCLCSFDDDNHCIYEVKGKNAWEIHHSLSGNYLGIVLKENESSTISFKSQRYPTDLTESICIISQYRKGPSFDGEEYANTATQSYKCSRFDVEIKKDLPSYFGESLHMFATYSMTLNWNEETEISITFSVPPGKPPQFFELKKLQVLPNAC